LIEKIDNVIGFNNTYSVSKWTIKFWLETINKRLATTIIKLKIKS
jgi:hypothetical protein